MEIPADERFTPVRLRDDRRRWKAHRRAPEGAPLASTRRYIDAPALFHRRKTNAEGRARQRTRRRDRRPLGGSGKRPGSLSMDPGPRRQPHRFMGTRMTNAECGMRDAEGGSLIKKFLLPNSTFRIPHFLVFVLLL